MAPLTNRPATGKTMLGGGQPMAPVQLDWGSQFSNARAIAIQSPATISAQFNGASDVVVEICGNQDCWIAISGITGAAGAGATADAVVSVGGTGTMFVSAGRFRQFYVPAGGRIAAIQNTNSGTLTAVPILLATS